MVTVQRKNKIRLIAFLLFLPGIIQAQSIKSAVLYRYVTQKRILIKNTGTINLFQEKNTSVADLKSTLTSHSTLLLNKKLSRELFLQRPLSVSLPLAAGNQQYQLELIQEDISGGKLPVGKLTGTGGLLNTDTVDIVHYRGYIAGDPQSIASLSVFKDGELMCLFSNASGNYNLGKKSDSTYILYNSSNMLARLSFECSTDQLPEITGSTKKQPAITGIPTPAEAPPALCKKVRVYWEASNKLYNNNFNSNFNNTVNYLSGLFNQVAVMYQNEGIIIELAQINVWTSTDPYDLTSANNGLATLKSRWNGLGNSFNGDVCVMVDGAPTNNGGVAYLLDNDLCNRAYAYGYTDIYATYNAVPVYSWDVEVLSHEMGHLMGSHHTHWCGWNTGSGGTCGAIDDCFPVEASAACTTCAAATGTNPAPTGFMGTVMSYCYLRSGIGVNLSYGFGPLPQAAMRSSINNAICPSFDNQWTGNANTAWENAANWSCGSLPNDKTDVTIPAGLTNYPVIKSNAVCRRLVQKNNSTVTVNPGFTLKITGSN